jgi:general secretion pathway protein D
MRYSLLLGAALLSSACATSSAYRAGQKAERNENYDKALLEYARASKAAPNNLTYRKSLERARLRASEEHTFAGRRLAARGLMKEALDELRLALDLNPQSTLLADEIRELETQRAGRDQAGSMQQVKEKARESVLPGLDLGPAAREPLGLVFRNASLKDTYQALGKTVGVNFVFDPAFTDTTINLDLRNVTFEQALKVLASYGRTFHTVGGEKVINVIPDTAAKRREYEQQVVKTFFLSNADLREVIDLLRIVLGSRRVAPLPGQNAITINDAPDKIAAAEHIINTIDKKKAEVIVEVELLEVSRNKLAEYGIELTSSINGGGIKGAIFPSPFKLGKDDTGRTVQLGALTLKDNPYDASNLLISNLPGVVYTLLKTDGSTRILAHPRLRTSDGQTAQARFGQQVPVPVTTFTAIATGGLNSQPFTSFNYKDVGVNIDLTPRVHDDGEVTLLLKLDISSLSDSIGVAGVQGLPTFNSRIVTSQLRLKDGETTALAGLISDTERSNLTGIPGLSDLPLVGRLFGHSRREVVQTDIILTLTPHIVMRPEITVEDLRSFPLQSETPPLLFEVPAIPPASNARPSSSPSTDPTRSEPIRPPAPTPTPTAGPERN